VLLSTLNRNPKSYLFAIVGAEGPALRQGDDRVLVPIEKIQQADRNLDEAAREGGDEE